MQIRRLEEKKTPMFMFMKLFLQGRKEGNVLFNDAFNTCYLRLYGVGHMVMDHSDRERVNPLPLLFTINSDGSSDRSFMVDPLSYFSFQPVLHDWCNKGRGMYYPVCGMMHIK